jgi:hypothetical protein
MSLIGTVANYGGKQPSNTQNIKQFVIGINNNQVNWVYKNINGMKVQTPANSESPVYISGDLYVVNSIFNTSDRLLKDNIIDIPEIKIKDILNLNPIEFTFKADINQKKHYGFIAQEVEKIYPELVTSSYFTKSVNYIELIPLLLSKMKSMQNEIDDLKQNLAALDKLTQIN